jgi:hypothetical protein
MPKRRLFKLATFLPSEVATITGVSVGLQRTWRHQGYSESVSGGSWTRHSLLQTAALLVQGELFKRGIPPRVSRICATAAAPQILLWAQGNPRATASRKGSKPRGLWLKEKGTPHRFLIQWGIRKKDYEFTSDLNAFYRRKRSRDLLATITIDLKRLANHLVTSAGRPLATVSEFP